MAIISIDAHADIAAQYSISSAIVTDGAAAKDGVAATETSIDSSGLVAGPSRKDDIAITGPPIYSTALAAADIPPTKFCGATTEAGIGSAITTASTFSELRGITAELPIVCVLAASTATESCITSANVTFYTATKDGVASAVASIPIANVAAGTAPENGVALSISTCTVTASPVPKDAGVACALCISSVSQEGRLTGAHSGAQACVHAS